jgi:hypothetical protein
VSDSPDGTLALARSGAEAIRGLNHATLGGDGLGQPADAYEVLGELSLAASGLPQLPGQVGRWLAAALAAGRLGCDDGADPAGAITSRPQAGPPTCSPTTPSPRFTRPPAASPEPSTTSASPP